MKKLWLCSILISGFLMSYTPGSDELGQIDEITVKATRKETAKRDLAGAIYPAAQIMNQVQYIDF
ncbi:MAG: hypothetical protein IID58_09240 [Proteobacteria bacterium]|nr:hypothetical protein [Pseudomonadota bacterium]